MKNLAEILEEELSAAVKVKNPKSLHRYITLLTGTHVEQETHERRFQSLQKQIDARLSAYERIFDRQHKLISIGFTFMALIITAFNLSILLS